MEASAPSITGEFGENYHDRAADMRASGVFQNSSTSSVSIDGYVRDEHTPRGWTFDASRSSSVYGASDTIRPTSRKVKFVLKY